MEDGFRLIISCLDEAFGRTGLSELVRALDGLLFSARRRTGPGTETMPNYIARFRTYVRRSATLSIKIPDELQAFLLLRKASLARDDRRGVLSSAGGILDLMAISTSPKNIYPDGERQPYDRQYRNKKQTLHPAAFANVMQKFEDDCDECMAGSDDDDGDTSDRGKCADGFVTEEEQGDTDAEFQDCEGALDELEEVYITYREAKARSQAIRNARGYRPRIQQGRRFGGRRWNRRSPQPPMRPKFVNAGAMALMAMLGRRRMYLQLAVVDTALIPSARMLIRTFNS